MKILSSATVTSVAGISKNPNSEPHQQYNSTVTVQNQFNSMGASSAQNQYSNNKSISITKITAAAPGASSVPQSYVYSKGCSLFNVH